MNKDEKARHDDQVECAFLEAVARRLPMDDEVLRPLAEAYTRLGDYGSGLGVDRQLARLCPEDPLVWYNLACSHALLGAVDEAVAALGRAVEIGYDDYDWMKQDRHLDPLRDDPRFQSLLEWVYAYGDDEEESYEEF
ncbi:TPR end-of-group domain-containing protein [Kiritimatiella glycovorans]|uniref:Uncharacterized protein n=1 Tax=Kiritimatiella glycovorans TaxID=1307763 RepID=A0A0G3EIW3_9BACT|nr:hypothetical protein [Kiritimatiella glycovorans]AKJ64109.1 hypothetical protein L21SP4_00846 [Kiritimatiella glycovorans]